MRRIIAVVLLLTFTKLAAADVRTTWNKVRYNGGPLQTKVDPMKWNNIFTATPQQIRLVTHDGQVFECTPKEVIGLSYGQEPDIPVPKEAPLPGPFRAFSFCFRIVFAPLAQLSRLSEQHLHFIGIEYARADSIKGGLMIQGTRRNYRQMLFQLRSVTGKDIVASEKDQRFLNR
jgi:hypothetical protein